jgi:hypothetical protein
MKKDKIVLGVETQNGHSETIDINVSKLDEPFKGCIVANILCGEQVDNIIYGTFSIDVDNELIVFTAENGDVYKFDINYNKES